MMQYSGIVLLTNRSDLKNTTQSKMTFSFINSGLGVKILVKDQTEFCQLFLQATMVLHL